MKNLTITTVAEFAEACKDKDSNFIYELFEYEIEAELRREIYDLAYDESGEDVCEPCRAAMIILANQYNIQSLIDY